jgi:hypothetical protein
MIGQLGPGMGKSMRQWLRILRRIVVWGTLAVLGLFLATLAINAFDESLSTEAKALLQAPPNHYMPEDNIYVALAGFDAPAPLQFKGAATTCPQQSASFFECVREHRSDYAALLNDNRELYQRYLALHRLSGYYETAQPAMVTPFHYPPTGVRNLFLAQVAVRAQSSDASQRQEGLDDLARDLKLWRRMLTGNGTLVAAMLSISSLQADYRLLSDLIADLHISIPAQSEIFPLNSNLKEWNIGPVFAGEFRAKSLMYEQIRVFPSGWNLTESDHRWIRGPMRLCRRVEAQYFKLNATENLDAKLMNAMAAYAAAAPLGARNPSEDFAGLLSIRTLYNPIGRILLRIAAPAYGGYVPRAYDGAALERLVRLSWEIRRQQIEPSAIRDFMRQHPEWSTHPLGGTAFVWKPDLNEIAMQPVGEWQPDRRFSVRIWRRLP